MADKIKDRTRYRTGITTNDKREFYNIVMEEMVRNGRDPKDISMLSPVSIAAQAFTHLIDNVSVSLGTTNREMSLIHAQRYSSLMNQLIQHVDEVAIAKPSTIEMFVRIPMSDVLTYGKRIQANTWEVQYTDNNTVMIDSLPFKPVEKVIYVRLSKNPDASLTPRVYIKHDNTINEVLTQIVTIDGVKVLGFKCKFKQVEEVARDFSFGDDQLQMFIIDEDKPIADIDLYYRDDGASPWRAIGKRLYYTRSSEDFLEYRIESQKKIRIDYKYVQGGFKPKIGGQLRAIVQLTSGRDVYTTAQAVPQYIDTAMAHVDYEPVGVDYYQSTGAKLATVEREYLRNYIIKLKGARRRIDTESDFKTFLLNYPGESKFEPRIVRNDIKERIINIYTTLSFRSDLGTSQRSFTIPTNTVNLTIDKSTLDSKTYDSKTYYSFSDRHLIKSTQTRMSNFATILPGVDPLTGVIPFTDSSTISMDPTNISVDYYYVTPFNYSYDVANNFLRVYQAAQYDVPYLSFSKYEIYDTSSMLRFINTSIRVNDYLDFASEDHVGTKNVFQLRAQCRVETNDYAPILKENFQATLRFKDADGITEHTMYANAIEIQEDGKIDIIFDIRTDRKIWGNNVEITYKSDLRLDDTKTAMVKTKTEFELVLTRIYPPVEGKAEVRDSYGAVLAPAVPPVPVKYEDINIYRAEVQLFKDITASLYSQSSISTDGLFRFLSVPLVEATFWRNPKNRKHIVDEIERVYTFLDTEVYDELDEYAVNPQKLHDKMETLFRVAIKFTKTYGLSRFLDVGNTVRKPIINLQLSPTAFIRKSEQDFDESGIASQLNSQLITHDYFMEDFNMNAIVYDTLDKAGDSVSIIQFTNLDRYPPDHLTIMRNQNKPNNWDPPEVLSLKPVYVPEMNNYKFNMTFIPM